MNGISDAVVIGVVLGLIFAAVSYYIYSRTTQIERKVGLIENILLDLKVTTEQALLNATEGGGLTHHEEREDLHQHASLQQEEQEQEQGQQGQQEQGQRQEVRVSREDTNAGDVQETREVVVDQGSRGRTQPAQPIVVEREQPREVERDGQSVSTNYELMTYKELTALAKKLGISGLRNQSKAFVIDAIRAHEQGGGAAGGSSGSVGAGAANDEPTNRSGQSNLTQWATGTVNFQDGAVNPLNDVVGDASAPGAMNEAQGDADGAPLGAGDVETSLVA